MGFPTIHTNFWAGIFIGAFYGAAAVGTYSSLKTAWLAYRFRNRENYR